MFLLEVLLTPLLNIFHGLLIQFHKFEFFLLGLWTISKPPSYSGDLDHQYTLAQASTPSWHTYVRASRDRLVEPVRVLSEYTRGNVSHADGFLSGSVTTILTRDHVFDEKPSIVVDFGQNTVGLLTIDFAGSSNYSTGRPGLRLAFSETLQFLSDRSDFSRSYNGDTITPGTDQIAVNEESYTWIDQHGCQHGRKVCSDGLHGFRYVKIYLDALTRDSPHTSLTGSISITGIKLQLSAFLGTPDTFTGWFESSDKTLNQWWYDSVYTNDLCTDVFRANDTEPRNAASPSLEGKLVLHDGPKRDRDPYVGDLAVASRTSYLTRNVSEASRNVLADLAEHQRDNGWIPPASINNYTLALLDYPLYWITCSYDYFLHTNDTNYITQYYPVLVKTLEKYYPSITNKTSHLITKGIGDSGWYGDYAFLPRRGAVTYYNALYVIALDNAAIIARHLNKSEDERRWYERARKVSKAITDHRFDIKAGAFFDGDCGSSPCDTHAQDGNSLAIVGGIANRTISRSILHHLSTKHARPYGNAFYDNDVISEGFSQRVYAFISYFELEARFLTGEAVSALEEVRRLYGWMASQDPGVTVWEGIGTGGEPYEGGFTSMSHGWSTGIVPLLINNVLGVRPTSPGFRTWIIKPQPADLTWARGVVPTPLGPIEVSWEKKGGLFIVVDSPEGSRGKVSIPVDKDDYVLVNEVVVWEEGNVVERDIDGYVELDFRGGRHSIIVRSGIREEV